MTTLNAEKVQGSWFYFLVWLHSVISMHIIRLACYLVFLWILAHPYWIFTFNHKNQLNAFFSIFENFVFPLLHFPSVSFLPLLCSCTSKVLVILCLHQNPCKFSFLFRSIQDSPLKDPQSVSLKSHIFSHAILHPTPLQ